MRTSGTSQSSWSARQDCREYLTWTWPDWEAPVEGVLYESRGGWADAMQTVRHLAERARAAGARIAEGVEVTGFELGADGVEAVVTSDGRLECEAVVAAPGPWAAQLWEMLGLPAEIELAGGEARPLIDYWKAQEGQFALPGTGLGGRAGREAPVVHLDQAGGLRSDRDGARAAAGRLGDLLPHGPDRYRGHGGRASRAALRSRARPVRPRQSGARGRGRLCRVLRVGAGGRVWPLRRPQRRMAGNPRGRASSPTRPTTTRSATGCCRTHTRSLTPATASRCSRSVAWPPTTSSGASPASMRTGSPASSAGRPIWLPRGPTPGPEPGSASRAGRVSRAGIPPSNTAPPRLPPGA